MKGRCKNRQLKVSIIALVEFYSWSLINNNVCMCLLVYVMYKCIYALFTLLGMWDAYAYYYSYSPLMSCLHLVSYKLPASCPAAVKHVFHVLW